MQTRTATADVLTQWSIDYFPFSSIYPDQTNITLAASDPAKSIDVGVSSISIRRSKGSVSSQCTFSIVGPVPDGLFPGTWVVVKSTGQNEKGQPLTLLKYIGQIYNMAVDYIVSSETAIIQTRTTFHVREWSSALETPVRYDISAIVHTLNQPGALLSNLTGSGISFGQLREIITSSFNAYELAQLILTLIASISENDKISSIKAFGDIKLPEVATRMPTVPATLIDYLKMSGVSSSNPFSSGFAKVVTGVQKDGVYNKGDWNGIWESTNVASYTDKFNKEIPDRPISFGYAALASTGDTAWNLITKYCDPSINEFFTDIFYERKDDRIISQPFIMIRDKPFLMRLFKDALGLPSGKWTIYDDLPRTRIHPVYIQNFRFQNTFIDSPNYIRVDYSSQALETEAPKALSMAAGFKQLNPEINRFGGLEHFIETQFLNIDPITKKPTGTNEQWFRQLMSISMAWHSYNYKMGKGVLTLRDDNVPITCGMNVQFKIGEYELVGHVDTYEINATVHPDGRHETTSQVQLSRIVQDINGKLDFIPPDSMANLLHTTPYALPMDFTSFFGAILGSITGK